MTTTMTSNIRAQAHAALPHTQELMIDATEIIRAAWRTASQAGLATLEDDNGPSSRVWLADLADGDTASHDIAALALVASNEADRDRQWDAVQDALHKGTAYDVLMTWQTEADRTTEDLRELCDTALHMLADPEWWEFWLVYATQCLPMGDETARVIREYAADHPVHVQTLGEPLPVLPQPSASVPGRALAQAITRVAVAAYNDEDEARHTGLTPLTGIRVDIHSDRLTLMATDRYRLSVCEVPVSSGSLPTATLLLPARDLVRTAENLRTAPAVSIAAEGDALTMAAPGRTFTHRAMKHALPAYEDMVSTHPGASITVDTERLIEVLAELHPLDDPTVVRLHIDPGATTLQLRATTGLWQMHTDIPTRTTSSEEIDLAFNSTFLLDGLEALGQPTTAITPNGAGKPALLQDAAGRDPLRYLLMPFRISGGGTPQGRA